MRTNFDPKQGVFVFQKVGLKKASVFAGFCASHDSETFREIDEPTEFGRRECALHSYRALCWVLHSKEMFLKDEDHWRQLDSGHALERQIIVQEYINNRKATAKVDSQSLWRHKAIIESELFEGESRLRSLVIEGAGVLPVMFSSALGFDDPNAGKVWMTLSTHQHGDIFYCIFSFEDTQHRPASFLEAHSFDVKSVAPNRVIAYAIFAVENIVMAPSWVAALNSDAKDWILRLAASMELTGIMEDPFREQASLGVEEWCKTRSVYWI